MKILLINPPYQTLTSNLGVGHQVPLGLLMIGGALIDAGHEVQLLDAECRRLSFQHIIDAVQQLRPQLVMTGSQLSTVFLVAVVLLPGLVFIAGFSVWWRRR